MAGVASRRPPARQREMKRRRGEIGEMNLAPSEEEVAGKITRSPFPPTAHAAGPILLDESSVVAYSYLKIGESSF